MLLVTFLILVLVYLWSARISLKKIKNNTNAKKWQVILTTAIVIAVPAYVILFTVVGSILFSFFLGLVIDPLVPEEHREKMCDVSNSIVATFQPLVSDKEMLRHFEKNRAAMQKLADMVHEKKHRGRDGKGTVEFEELQKRLDVRAGEALGWSSVPYSIEETKKYEACMAAIRKPNSYEDKGKSKEQIWKDTVARSHEIDKCSKNEFSIVSIEPNFARSDQTFYCTKNRSTRKHYYFFPEAAPRIESGRLLGPVDIFGNSYYSKLVTTNTDLIYKKEDVYRQIDTHWFIALY